MGGGVLYPLSTAPQCNAAVTRHPTSTSAREKFFVFCFDSVTYIPLHGARRAMAAACRCPSRGTSYIFPPVYPFPTPGPACAVIVGVSLRGRSSARFRSISCAHHSTRETTHAPSVPSLDAIIMFRTALATGRRAAVFTRGSLTHRYPNQHSCFAAAKVSF